ncbi:spore germination protein [Bacillus sp. HMF5848]|uniref:spore germination protein n=1 Tax=Bacillus sp. HMF5848 TaxID=2495421 RepID=UPI000F7BA355|nr:spore germination protein [Bacillus sp. HMF5848]RSK29137.1 spore germination protein [Bacillus sp. HMF5848]
MDVNQSHQSGIISAGSKQVGEDIPIYPSLEKNIAYIKEALGHSSDLVYRTFHFGIDNPNEAAVIYTDGLIDKDFIQNYIMKTLMVDIRDVKLPPNTSSCIEQIESFSVHSGDLKRVHHQSDVLDHILSGDTVILVKDASYGLAISTRGWRDRGVEEPSTQGVVRGPKDGFTETLRTNTALLRRKIKDPNLWIDNKIIGARTKTDVSIAYINGIVNEDMIKEVHERLDRIDIDSVLEGGYLEEYIQDETYTPFPTVFHTERPDAVAAALLEGRIAIIVDGTPFVIVVPALFIHFFQSSEDYYQRADISTFIRFLRFLAFFLALLTPAVYIAITTYHQEMLPTTFLVSLAAQKEGTPLPAFAEALVMEVIFEILREAGVRLPKAVGSAISIVGALVLGQAAVEAGIVSAAMVIVVSLTAISSFVSPAYNMAISVRMLRFVFMLLATSFGLFGIIMGLIFLVLHLNSLRSFGIPYLAPFAPFNMNDHKDTLFRLPLWVMKYRPRLLNQKDITRRNFETKNK